MPTAVPTPTPSLVVPTTALQPSYLTAWDELGPEELRSMGSTTAGEEWTRDQLADGREFARFVGAVRAEADDGTVMPSDLVHQTVLWYADGDRWLGRLSIRHRMTPLLLELGGHIGYFVRPTARRRGYATAMLTASLPWAARLGIDPALVTCDTGNTASRRVIEAAGGELEDERHGKLRYWVATRTS